MAKPIHPTVNRQTSQAANRIVDIGKNTQFKMGKSGNPAGRPKRSESDQLVRQIWMRAAAGLRGLDRSKQKSGFDVKA